MKKALNNAVADIVDVGFYPAQHGQQTYLPKRISGKRAAEKNGAKENNERIFESIRAYDERADIERKSASKHKKQKDDAICEDKNFQKENYAFLHTKARDVIM